MRIAVDAMGGDAAPSVVIDGALLASRVLHQHKVILVGDEKRIQQHLAVTGYQGTGFEIVHAPESVGMHEAPMEALRRKKNSSIRKAAELVKEGKADAWLSAGNTGAAVAASYLSFGFLPGIRRAGIATPMPTKLGGVCVLIDAGANMAPTPLHLLQYGIMAEAYCKIAFNIQQPRIGLLNVGEEDAKGNVFTKETRLLLKESPLNFIGNVEGGDIFEGTCDIVLCDGFTGNAILKATEGVAEAIEYNLRSVLSESWLSRIGALLCRKAFRTMKSRMDYSECGGAPLLGVGGVTIITHGGANARAIFNSIRVAAHLAQMDINNRIIEGVEAIIQQGSESRQLE